MVRITTTHWNRIKIGLLSLILIILAACSGTETQILAPPETSITLNADGETHQLTTSATNVRTLLEEAGVELNETDEVSPPLFTPLTDNMTINVVRVTESIEIIEESLPFERKTVRNEAMDVDEPPLIIQSGRPGLQEITVRIVYHDGLEVERARTQVTLIEPPQDEIVMVGVGAGLGALDFAGNIAYMNGGQAVIMRGSTNYAESLNTGPGLDGRVFRLSPTGSHLLYTRVVTDTGRFSNSLFVLSTSPGATPRPLGVDNILWADWNPARFELLQIAYTTAIPVDVPPGWEANNDLFVGDVLQNEEADFEPQVVVEAYPATYAWWGGNYQWSPDGRFIAFSYADEVGLIDLEATEPEEQRIQLQAFTEFNTLADWVWIPSLAWSPDGGFLAFTNHGGEDPQAGFFDTWVANVNARVTGRFIEQSGMWSHPHWSPSILEDADNPQSAESRIAFLRASNPVDTLNSNYTLWLMDEDGSNARQVYPPVGENSQFSRDEQFMAWGPTGRDMAFIFSNGLHILNLDSGNAFRVTRDDTVASHPTWAPYGSAVDAAITGDISPATAAPNLETENSSEDFLPDE